MMGVHTETGVLAGDERMLIDGDWLSQGFAAIPMSLHYITNIESQVDGDIAHVRAMFYNPMQLPGM